MEDKTFVWTPGLTKRFFQIRFENDWLFKQKKQPWGEFRNILLENGFPDEMTLDHVRKKWSYSYDCYRLAKRTRNKSWLYYKLFDKHYGKTTILDKYESWSDEWRLKLITCIAEAKEHKVDFVNMWRTVERAMRCQDLPADCCVQDMKGLWHHIRVTFNRKHRIKLKKGSEISQWPLYETMVDYYQRFEPSYLEKLENETPHECVKREKISTKYKNKIKKSDANRTSNENGDFVWSRDITETFIQIRLQNDWLFREKKWAWNDIMNIMIQEYGFPETLTGKDICRKWAATYSDYQKAKATNNKSWVYYTLFELYLGEGSLSLNPLVGWQEEWVLNLIRARSDLERLFKYPTKDESTAWREVEMRLRSMGLPIDHSLLDLPEIWAHLLKTFKWKQKFANKGILNEQWPYYDAMLQYVENKNSLQIKKHKEEMEDQYDVADDDDFEDDMKLFDLKQRLQVKPKLEVLEVNHCRSCSNEDGCVNIFEQTDGQGFDLAYKLRIIGGIEVGKSDNLPKQICFNCLRELENAYKFRMKCQEVDKQFKENINTPLTHSIKIEVKIDENDHQHNNNNDNSEEVDKNDFDELDTHYDAEFVSDIEQKTQKLPFKKTKPKITMRMKRKMRKQKYVYWKVCEVCGKHTRNLKSHLDAHSTGKLYSCDVCDKKFKFKSGLIIHKAIHDPTPKKTCEICGKTFHILAQYRRHFVYHANERKYECETCGKRFNTYDILRVHKRSHTDERPFSCPDCGKTFRTAGCVSRHKRIVHRKTVKAQQT